MAETRPPHPPSAEIERLRALLVERDAHSLSKRNCLHGTKPPSPC